MCPSPLKTNLLAANKVAGVDGCDALLEKETPVDRVLEAGLFPPEESAEDDEEVVTDAESGADGEKENHEADSLASTHHDSQASVSDDGSGDRSAHASTAAVAHGETTKSNFTMEETLFIFDWDDTVLPSTWLQRQHLRLDDASTVSQWQREKLAEVANSAIELIRNAKQCGTVVLVTNAERGWIELSCRKFLPTLMPLLESVKSVSARTTFESRGVTSPLEWKLRAFESEISTIYSRETLNCSASRKNVLSLGDSLHEREALLRATADLPNCVSKALKFVERPDISQICKQQSLVNSCFDRVVHHDGCLDLCIKCT